MWKFSRVGDIVNHLWGILKAILYFHPDDRLLSMVTDQVVDKLIKRFSWTTKK